MTYPSRFSPARCSSPLARVLSGAALVLMLGSCGDGSAPKPAPDDTYMVEVHDTNYNLKFTYTTNRNFAYAAAPLPDFPQTSEEAQMLGLVNQERAKGGVCPLRGGGTQAYSAASPLHFEGHLHKAATLYARELAASGALELSHRSRLSGLVPSQRMVAAGYKPLPPNDTPMLFQESLAAEMKEIASQEVIAAWKASPEHCAALYEPLHHFSHGSVARVDTQIDGQAAAFWVLNTAGY